MPESTSNEERARKNLYTIWSAFRPPIQPADINFKKEKNRLVIEFKPLIFSREQLDDLAAILNLNTCEIPWEQKKGISDPEALFGDDYQGISIDLTTEGTGKSADDIVKMLADMQNVKAWVPAPDGYRPASNERG